MDGNDCLSQIKASDQGSLSLYCLILGAEMEV